MQKTIAVILLYFAICLLIPYLITMAMGGRNRNPNVEDAGNTLGLADNGEITDMTDYIVRTMAPYYQAGDSAEFLKAFAVVIRSYATNLDEGGDSFSPITWTYTQMEEAWGDYYPAYYEAVLAAVTETENVVMTMEEGEVLAYFTSLSAGYTRIVEGTCLATVNCSEDLNSPDYMTVVTLSGSEVLSKIQKSYPDIRLQEDITDSFQVVSRDEAGYITSLMVGNVTMSGDDLARVLGLNSGNFMITVNEGNLVFTVKGIGCGYGMSLYSARAKAIAGAGYKEILFYYYKNISLSDE